MLGFSLAVLRMFLKNFAEDAGYKRTIPLPPYYDYEHGQFSRRDDVTRFLTPSKRGDIKYLHWIVMHELTRHWLWSRNPRYSGVKISRAQAVAGYWVVAGFPMFICDGVPDFETGTIAFGRDALSLEVVRKRARSATEFLHPWKKLLFMDAEAIHIMNGKLPPYADGKRPSRLFEEQGAAICHYLYSADGRRA